MSWKTELYAICKRQTQSKRNQKGCLEHTSELKRKPRLLYFGSQVKVFEGEGDKVNKVNIGNSSHQISMFITSLSMLGWQYVTRFRPVGWISQLFLSFIH